ncbi:probable ATP-dependent RNA helicase DHX37 [Temnothorax curvispinosus]|uniref:Probable ATP-dependent RNA helicase DHX37 n=1 Tax=Temnothorax curvispinosus TaxID=300111 RepID=A0A6J1Q2R0_9HYME|nr:probable ATP-dependent RNA helicase DHX37 [Temnothorax curvispinosus]
MDTVDGVKWFAYFFLEGQVYPKLKRFVPSLLTTPGSITKSWARLIPHTQAIVQTLQLQGVVSKDKLLEIWGSDKKCEILIYKIIFRYYHRLLYNTRPLTGISAVMLAAMLILVKIYYTTDSIQVVLHKISIQ